MKKIEKMTQKFFSLLLTMVIIMTLLPTALVHGYDDNKNVELFTRVRGGDSAESDEITEAESGKIFWVESSFAFYPMDDSSEYVLPVIKVKVPENVETEIDPTLYSPDIIQACYEFYDQTAKQKYINFIFASPVAPGLSGTVAFKARFKNTATKNGETAVFESGLAAKYLPNGESATREITAKTARAEIRCLAAETWETRKSVVAAETERGTGNDKDKFFVTYEIMAGLASVGLDTGGNPDTSRTSYDSFGRLAFDTDSAATSYGGYLLSDKLPDAPVPDGGATFVSLEMVNEKGTRFPLHETTATKPGDYKLALKPDGSLDSVAISKHLTAAAEGHNDTPAGYSIENKYYLKISYPNDKYATPSNQDAKIYDLVNTAELKYKLIGESERTTDDNASVKLGWPEDTTKPVRLELRKYIKLGDENARPLDAALASAYGKAQFTLYSDMNGTIATDIKNNAVAPVETSTVMSENPSGVLAFENLRFGTYYIKETLIPTGFAKSGDYRYVNSDYIEVAIASDGTVSFKDAKRAEKTAKQLEVVNQATEDGVGAILFYKKGQGFEDTAAKVLSGVQFTLCDKDGAAIQKNGADFTAISDAAGLVRFEGVPASKAGVTYTIKETSVPEAYSGKGFNGINPSTISVTLKGGEIKTVGLDVVNGVGTVTNTSTLGKFSFTKVDATDSAKRLAGAVFELHKSSSRPAGESTKIAEITVPAGGVYTSELLEAGKYWLREKSAPAGYSIEKNTDGSDIWYSVDVSPRTTTALAENIKNVPYGTLALLKYGRWGTTAGFDGTQIGLNFLALEGIEFTVRPCDKSGTVAVGAASYAITTVIDATGKASYSLSDGAGKPINDGSKGALLLPAGFYLVSEVESSLNAKYPNSGYNVLAPFVVEVNGGSKTEQLVYNDTDYGRIRIIKKDNLGTKLANVEFDIYYSDGTLADTVKTGNDGIAYSRQLASDRTYYIEERAISNDFEPIERITGISDPDGNHEGDATFNKQGEYISLQSANHGVTVTINVTNFRHVSVKVIKRDSDTLLGKTVYLEGAKFDLYDSATGGNKLNTEPFTTLADGSFIINGLIPSTDYWIEEIGAPTAGGYIIPSGRIMIKTNTGVATVPVDNTRYAHLEILKQGDFGGTTTALAGAEFNVYRDSVSSPVLGTIVTSADGHGTLLDSTGNPVELVAGKYVLVETKAPADYKIDTTPIEVVLKSGDNTVYYKGTAKETVKNAVKKISNAPDYGKIRIKKVSSADTGHGIKAIFNVYAATPLDSVNYDMSKAVGTIETEHWNGIGVSGKLKEGNYKLVEVTVKPDPDGQEYVIGAANSFECSVVAGQITGETAPHVFENQPKGKIKVVKEGVWTDKNGNLIANIPLSGAEFELYEQNGARVSWLDSNGTAQSVLVTDSNGEAMTGYIAPGSYTVKEIKAPDGYDLAAGAERAAVINVTDQQTKIVTVRFENKPYVGRLTIAKIDRSLNLITTGKAKFEIYRTLLTGEIPRDTVTYNGKELVLVKAVSTTGGRVTLNDLPVFKTDGDRASGNLEYFVKEIEAPSGYKFTQEWTGPVVLAAGSEVEHSVVDYSQTAGVGASKVDQDGRGLANAYISLFESKDEADKVNAYLAANPLNPSGDVAAQIKALKTAYPEIKDVQKSDKNGKFAFKGLTDAIYYALEIVPSVNYTRSDTVYTIKVVMAGKVAQLIDTVTNKPLSIVNIEYGRIKIKKQGYLGSSYVEDINGATFTVYKAAGQGQGNCLGSATAHVHDSSCRYTKGGEVKLNFTVSDGQYFSAPLPAGDYIVAETKAPAGYEMDPGAVYEWHVRVDSGTNSPNTWLFANPVSNYWNGGRFTFKKVSSISATTKVDASFKLFKMENGLWTEQETFQTRNGSYTSRLLPLGKYKIVECASIGYTVPSGAAGVREFEISIKGTTVDLHTITNDPQASIKLKKTGLFAPQNEARNLAGVTFGLFASEQEARAAKEDSALYKSTTLADGSATFIGIDAKTEANGGTEYWLGEISVGSANTPEFSTAWFTPFAIKVYAGQALNFGSSKSLNVVNDTHYGKLLIKKVDKNDVGTMLPGAVFELLTKNLSGGYDEVRVGNVKMTITTESSGAGLGTGMSGLLPAGEYYLRETAAPIGYKPDATINGPFTVSTNQITDTTGTPITNEKYQSVRIKKVSTYDSGGTVHERGPLGGIQFGIYATKALAQQGDHAAALQLATTVSTAGAGQGWATFSKLDPNTTYYIRELYAPAKYLMSDKVFEVTTDNLGSRDVAETAVNVERGSLEIRKVGKWKTQDSTGAVSEQMIPLDGAEFALFTNSADIIPISGTTQKTANGRCVWNDLIPGTYYIKETATVYGFAQSTEVFKATVTSGGATDVLEGKTDNVIENSPNKGKFIVEKQGSDGTHPAINGATFELYKKNSAGVYEKFVPETSTTGRTHTFTVSGEKINGTRVEGVYISEYVPVGDYKIIETESPKGYVTQLDSSGKPMEYFFKVDAGITSAPVVVRNDAKSDILITKRGAYDRTNSNATKVRVSGAEFKLYEKSDPATEIMTSTDNKDGSYSFSDVCPGEYIVKETKAPQGYDLNPAPICIDVLFGATANAVFKGEIVDFTNAGKIKVIKQDKDTHANLAGAEFEIYKAGGELVTWLDGNGNTVSKLVTDTSGEALSGMIPAQAGGTVYNVIETKAPAGYSLDPRIVGTSAQRQQITVYPVHTPSASVNTLSFMNGKGVDEKLFPSGISKKIVSPDPNVEQRSLMFEQREVCFGIYDYTNAQNPLPLENFTVTDNFTVKNAQGVARTLVFEYEQTPDNWVNIAPKNGDFDITEVRIYKASDSTDGRIDAIVEYQTFAALGSAEPSSWLSFSGNRAVNLQNLTEKTGTSSDYAVVDLSKVRDNVMGLRIRYIGTETNGAVGKNFSAAGFDFKTVFAKR
ncbi:MAG: SpaA isopeptide-forming pilin-related protein [Oscillospiraceae bacterium]